MTSGDATVTGIVVVAHGGQSDSLAPTSPTQLAVLRMVPIAAAIRNALKGSDAVVCRPRFAVRGWNGGLASPVPDLNRILDELAEHHGQVPMVLVGHSMGGRAVLRCAGHPGVTAVAGLAPWLPDGEPVDQLAGRRVLLVHGTADRMTDPLGTWAYAVRARAVTEVTTVEVPGGDHAMLRQAHRWHQLAADFARSALRHDPFTASRFQAG